MAEIQVTSTGPRAFRVAIEDGGSSTAHEVTVPEGYQEELGVGDVPLERLVEASFAYLLEREPKESILPRFDLPVIARYFSEYPAEIARRLG